MEFKQLLDKLYSERNFEDRKVEESKLDELMSHAWRLQWGYDKEPPLYRNKD